MGKKLEKEFSSLTVQLACEKSSARYARIVLFWSIAETREATVKNVNKTVLANRASR